MSTEPSEPIGQEFLYELSNPARRALESAGITTLEEVAKRTEKELLLLHGLGPKTIRQLRPVLEAAGLSFAGS